MSLEIRYTTQIWREGDQFVAHAMPLDIASSGASPEEANSAIEEAVRLFLATAAEHGTLDAVLEDAGYEKSEGEWQCPEWFAVSRGGVVLGA